MDLKGRHFLTLKDFTPEEIIYLLDLAAELKEKKKKGILVDHHRGKNVPLSQKNCVYAYCLFQRSAPHFSLCDDRQVSLFSSFLLILRQGPKDK